jgi:methionyl-tRNA synthetase
VSFYVTTPIYYVNAQPHLGHAYTTIAADVLARHMRQRGEDTFFLTGTDEHGEPVADVAEREGIPPRELADRNVVHFKEMAAKVNASNDFFIRTSDPEHGAAVRAFMQELYDRGEIYPGTYEGWYCPRCADFKTEQEIVDGNKCPIHKIELNWEKEDNYFFRLSAYQERLEQLYAGQPDFVMPKERYNEAVGFIRQGLEDVSCTRARLRWGVKAPWDESQVFYVWFDALLNYLTALSYARPGEDLTERYWPADFHLIGKDILKFHAVIWPAMLMAAGVVLPRHLFIHGFLLMQGEKMSKSLGNVLDPFKVIDVFGTDALRYYCLREVSFGQDGSVSTEGFEARYNAELANEYGNLASRTLAMIARYRDGVLPQVEVRSPELTADLDGLAEAVRDHFDRAQMTAALEAIWSRGVRRLNRYVEEQAPWTLAKDGSDERLDQVLHGLAEGIRVVSVLLHPYMPDTTTRLLGALGHDDLSLERATFGAVPGGAAVGKLPPLFPKVEPAPAA